MKYRVTLESVGNPDFRQYAPLSDPEIVEVNTIEEASAVCREYIVNNALGGGNWSGGGVFDKRGKQVAYISYNGSYWTPSSQYFVKRELPKKFRFKPNKKTGTVANKSRAIRGEQMVALSLDHGQNDPVTDATDAVADILHYCDREGVDVDEVLSMARQHWDEER